jgi:hypothetical protein
MVHSRSVNNPRLVIEGESTWPAVLCLLFALQILNPLSTTYAPRISVPLWPESERLEGESSINSAGCNNCLDLHRGPPPIGIVMHELSPSLWENCIDPHSGIEVLLRLTVSRPVYLSIGHRPGTHDHIFNYCRTFEDF